MEAEIRVTWSMARDRPVVTGPQEVQDARVSMGALWTRLFGRTACPIPLRLRRFTLSDYEGQAWTHVFLDRATKAEICGAIADILRNWLAEGEVGVAVEFDPFAQLDFRLPSIAIIGGRVVSFQSVEDTDNPLEFLRQKLVEGGEIYRAELTHQLQLQAAGLAGEVARQTAALQEQLAEKGVSPQLSELDAREGLVSWKGKDSGVLSLPFNLAPWYVADFTGPAKTLSTYSPHQLWEIPPERRVALRRACTLNVALEGNRILYIRLTVCIGGGPIETYHHRETTCLGRDFKLSLTINTPRDVLPLRNRLEHLLRIVNVNSPAVPHPHGCPHIDNLLEEARAWNHAVTPLEPAALDPAPAAQTNGGLARGYTWTV